MQRQDENINIFQIVESHLDSSKLDPRLPIAVIAVTNP